MRKIYYLMLFNLFFSLSGHAQETNTNKFQTSTRQSLTWVLRPYSGAFQDDVKNTLDARKIGTPSKMDNNKISKSDLSGSNYNLELLIKENKIPNLIFKKIFTKGNEFSLENISDKAKNNMSDSDALTFSVTSIGTSDSAERKFFNAVLGSNYIAALEVNDVRTQEEQYDRIDNNNKNRAINDARDTSKKESEKYKFTPVNRVNTGYLSDITTSMYKIKMDSEEDLHNFEITVFGENGENTDEQKFDALTNYPFTLKKISSNTNTIKGVENKAVANTKNYDATHYFNKLFSNTNLLSGLTEITQNIDVFKTKAAIYETKPNIQVKIGTKESLYTNKRFFVYEQVMDKKGGLKAKKRGVMRVKGKPANNQGIAKGDTQPSSFYQIQGKKLDKGMLAEENKNSFSFGFGYGSNNVNFGADYYLPVTSLKLFAEYGVEANDLESNYGNPTQKLQSVALSAGLVKELHFANNFYLGLSLGAIKERTFAKEDDNFNETFELNGGMFDKENMGSSKLTYRAGTTLGIYISSGVRLSGTIIYAPIKYDEESVFVNEIYYNQYERSNTRYNISLNFSIPNL